jgi:endonuclease-3
MAKRAQPAARSQRGFRVAGILEGHLGSPAKPRRRSSPLDTLIATVLSQNTNDQNSYKAWLSLRKRFPTWEKVASSPWQALATSIEVGGLKNQKALRIKKILRSIYRETGKYDLGFLNDRSDDEVMEYLLSMKGVGKKTAACVLVFSLGWDVFPVDTHIHRICNRLGLVRTKSADQTYDAMKGLVPKGRAYSFHVNLIRFGRETCKAKNPLCGTCPLFLDCIAPEKQCLATGANVVRGVSNKRKDFLITEQIVRDRAG